MQRSHARLICRSHNPFTLSVALWQHFGLPDRRFVAQPRAFNSTTTTTQVESTKHPISESANHQTSARIPIEDSETPSDSSTASQGGVPRSAAWSTPVVQNGRKVSYTTAANQPTGRYKGQRADGWQENQPYVNTHANPHRKAWVDMSPNPEALLVATRTAINEHGDYEATVMRPRILQPPFHGVKQKDLPWVVKNWRSKLTLAAMERLDIEITRFHQYIKPNQIETLARRQLIQQVRSHTYEALPEVSLQVFGSQRTGLALATSDIDLRLTQTSNTDQSHSFAFPPHKSVQERNLKYIRKLYKNLMKKPEYSSCDFLYARYPLVSVFDRACSLDVQIVLANDTSLSISKINEYIREYPFIRPLYSVIKVMFEVRGLSDTFRGGFGSYTIFMMIVASLRHCVSSKAPQTAAEGLKVFLSFWSTFDTTTKGISIEPVELYDKATEAPMTLGVRQKLQNSKIKPAPAFYLSLRDPADISNDLGRKAIAIKHLQKTLHFLDETLKTQIHENSVESLILCLVGQAYSMYYERRRKLRAQGQAALNRLDLALAQKAKHIQANPAVRAAPSRRSDLDDVTKLDHESANDHGGTSASNLVTPSAGEFVAEIQVDAPKMPHSELLSQLAKTPDAKRNQDP